MTEIEIHREKNESKNEAQDKEFCLSLILKSLKQTATN